MSSSQRTIVKQAGIEPFYFGAPEKQLFGCYHPPSTETRRDCGIVLCYPMGEEYIRFHRAFRQLAILLSRSGFPVLRFDYYACGDSSGDCEEGDIEQWLADSSTAIGEIRQRCGVSRSCLVGLRLGASLAVMTGANRNDIDRMVLWDPVINGIAYVEELIGWHTDLTRYSHVKTQEPGKGNESMEVLGFPLGHRLRRGLEEIDLLQTHCKPASNVLVIGSREQASERRLIEHLAGMGVAAEHLHIPSPQLWNRSDRFWLEDVTRVVVPHQILQPMVSWITEGSQ